VDLSKLVIPSAFEVGKLVADRYRVVSHTPAHEPDAAYPVIGFGGMGNVYRCEDQHLPRTVALKTLSPTLLDKVPPSQRQSFVQRFMREVRLVANLNHPCIMPAYDCGVVNTDEGPYPFHVSPFNPQSYTASWVASEVHKGRSPLTLEETQGVLIDVAAGIHYIHQSGWVLRDIKPPNIILEPDEALGAPRARLIDFGVVKKLNDQEQTVVTCSGMVMGTDPYLSPELIRGAQADVRSDLWAFGITMYELLFGMRPFRASEPGVLRELIQNEVPVWPSQCRDDIKALRGFDHIFRWLVEKKPEDRCNSAKLVYEAIRDIDELPPYDGPNARPSKAPDGEERPAALHMMVMPSLRVREQEQSMVEDPRQTADARPAVSGDHAPKPSADEAAIDALQDEEPQRLPRKTAITSLLAIAAGLVAIVGVAISVTKPQPPAVPQQISVETVKRPHKPLNGPQLLAEEEQMRRQQLLGSAGPRATPTRQAPIAAQPQGPTEPRATQGSGVMRASRRMPVGKKPAGKKPPVKRAVASSNADQEDKPLPNVMGTYTLGAADKAVEQAEETAAAPRPSQDLCAAKLRLAWTSNAPNAPILATLTEDCGDIPRGSQLRGESPSFRIQGNVAYLNIELTKLTLPGHHRGVDVRALAYERDGRPGLVVEIDAKQQLAAAEATDTGLDIAEELSKLSPLRSPGRIINEKRRGAARLRAEHVSVPLPQGRAFSVLFMEEA
jgi:serine/threonine protein kinase